MYTHTCNKCKITFTNNRPRGWVCPECQRTRYIHKTVAKSCAKCKTNFVGTVKQTLCPACRQKRGVYKYKHSYKIIFVCKHCGVYIKSEDRYCTRKRSSNVDKSTVCDVCRKKRYKNTAMRMTLYNPSYKGMSYEEALKRRKPKHVPEDIKRLNKEKTSRRMKTNNPMKCADVVAKMLHTKSTRRYTYKTGTQHHLWKGNRTVARQIKQILLPWKRMLMKAANYQCTLCGASNCTLNVHHLTPYRDIQANIFAKYNIKDPSKLSLTDKTLTDAMNEIVKYHNDHPEIGIVVCEPCHASIDPYFKPRKRGIKTI